jgi:hypothetical protein
MTWDKVAFQSGNNNNDNMGIDLMIRPGAAQYKLYDVTFSGGPNQVIDQTWTPLFYAAPGISGCCGGGGEPGSIAMRDTSLNRRGFLEIGHGGSGLILEADNAYRQGGITPEFAIQSTNGNLGGQVSLNFIEHDTESQAAYAWICNIACTGGGGPAFHLGFVNQVSQDAGTIPAQITGGENSPITNVIAGHAMGDNGSFIGLLYSNGVIQATIPLYSQSVIATHLNQSTSSQFAGAGTMTGGTMSFTFPTAYSSPPVCTANDATTAAAIRVTTTATTLTLTGTSGDMADFICVGNPN